MSKSTFVPCSGPWDAVSRRSLMLGGLGGLLTSRILTWQTLAAADKETAQRTLHAAKSCVLLWMNGGPSHVDTVDPKPHSKFKPIPTKISDVSFSEHLPQLAEQADKLAVIRGMTSKEGNHDRGHYLMHTGYAPSVTLQHPSFGSWVSHELGDRDSDLPAFVCLRGSTIGAGFIGVEHNPFTIRTPEVGVENLALPKDVDSARFSYRRDALRIVQDQFARATRQPGVTNHDKVVDRAVKLMSSSFGRVFDVSQEPASLREEYGSSEFGKACLVARRLVEAGVRFVEVTLDGWDTHVDNFTAVKNLSQELDPGFATLLKDLAQRKLLESTLVIWMGEFGRSPKINSNDGRDHHPAAWSAMLAGGNARVGHAFGSTDGDGNRVTADSVTVPNFFATLASLLGIDPHRELMSPVGRPIAVSDSGQPVRSLIAEA